MCQAFGTTVVSNTGTVLALKEPTRSGGWGSEDRINELRVNNSKLSTLLRVRTKRCMTLTKCIRGKCIASGRKWPVG